MPPPPCDEEVLTMTVGSYSEATKLANGSCIKSAPVHVGGHSWRVVLYPNGRLVGTTGFMSLYLQMDEDEGGGGAAAAAAAGDDVHVVFILMMRDVGGRARYLTSGKVAAAFGRKGDACGNERFVSREHFVEFFKSGDRFAIRRECDLTIFPAGSRPELGASRRGVVQPPEPPVLRARAPPLSGLHADLGRLLATKEGADVEFEVGGKIFAAHKSVLAAQSAVFKEEFFGPTKEKDTSYVRISDMHPESFKALLHFMYTDSLPEMTMNSLKEGAVLAEDLLIAAGRYNLKDLKSLTENKLCSHVGVSTVLLMLAIAEQYQCCKMKKMCLGFIGSRANAWAIIATNDIENLARSSPSAVKDVIVEILDTRMARSKRLIKAFIFACCFQMLLLVFIWYF
ncbi:hypothetical protein PVAP13_2NG023695 [Panicum virgatum]|uniref:Uncharacterized protein n=1 Tax=Panicum virgatum TaxID=38727 RepID=A0A8T0VA36_PANVG|nr:hypothetical protein PVAP13_2NG023695 [Panicum virgatum]